MIFFSNSSYIVNVHTWTPQNTHNTLDSILYIDNKDDWVVITGIWAIMNFYIWDQFLCICH